MHKDHDSNIAQIAASLKCGSIVAAAGCGKTEQIARATDIANGRRLILTHTHAGVDALRLRLKKNNVPPHKYRVDTIAGWCLWYTASFPKRSGLSCDTPKEEQDWNVVYEAAIRLMQSGAVRRVLESSYSGVFVDEYQDCTVLQHQLLKEMASLLPVCVFGDPLQAIFDFKGQKPVNWDTDVFPVFERAGELTTPWRWHNAGNVEMANWLAHVRRKLEISPNIDLADRPECVTWELLPNASEFRQAKIVGTCKKAMGNATDQQLAVIGEAANMNTRARLARSLANVGFSTVEPLAYKVLYRFAKEIEAAEGVVRLQKVLDFIRECMVGVDKKAFLDSVISCQVGGKLGKARFGNVISNGVAIANGATDKDIIDLMQGFDGMQNTRLFRREMFFAMRSALLIKATNGSISLSDAIWHVLNRIRHAGRQIGMRCVGSTLLLKGLEFDHSVIVYSKNMTRKDWYVALTRATKSVTVLCPSETFPLLS